LQAYSGYLTLPEEERGLPTYDYRCTKCGNEFAVEQSIVDKPLRKCRKCGGKLEKLLPKSVNLIFKGSGFYITDYGKRGGKRPEAGDNGPAEKAKAKPAEKAKAKPAEKAAAGGEDRS
jgi:putative FmdB family regulatory protein